MIRERRREGKKNMWELKLFVRDAHTHSHTHAAEGISGEKMWP